MVVGSRNHVDVVLCIIARGEEDQSSLHIGFWLFLALRVAPGIVGEVIDSLFQQVELVFEDALEVLVVEVLLAVETIAP